MIKSKYGKIQYEHLVQAKKIKEIKKVIVFCVGWFLCGLSTPLYFHLTDKFYNESTMGVVGLYFGSIIFGPMNWLMLLPD